MTNLLPAISAESLGLMTFQPLPDVEPFSIRTAASYEDILSAIRVWIRDQLVPYLNTNTVQAAFQDNLNTVTDTVNAALAGQSQTVTAALNTAVQEIVASAIIVQDPVVAGVVHLSPAPVGNGGNDTASLNAWLTGLPPKAVGTMRSAAYLLAGTVAVPDGKVLNAAGATFTGIGSTGGDFITLGNSSYVIGAEIVGGTRPSGDGIKLNGVSRARAVDNWIHDLAGTTLTDGRGIAAISNASKYQLRNNRIENVHAQGINVDTASYGRILGNSIDTALHGIQWWGGDSSVSSTIGIQHLVIANNTVRNVKGGIWGSLGQFIDVAANDVDTCSDVGIDFEGCQDCTATGNSVHNAVNACYSTFYGCTRILIVGNTGLNDTANGAGGINAGYKAFAGASKTSTYVTVEGNSFTTPGHPIITDAAGISDSVIKGNTLINTATGARGIRLLSANQMTVTDNTVRVTNCNVGIGNEGGSDSAISRNTIITTNDVSAAGSNSGGVFNYWVSTTYPAARNIIKDNVVKGFVQGVFDDQWGSGAAAGCYTLIENNIVPSVYRSNNGAYTGVVANNRVTGTNAAVTPVLV
jgi:hypothetical protein